MPLSRIAQEFADEIRNHNWSDSPWRLDRAGHDPAQDRGTLPRAPLSSEEADNVKTNVMWVTAQVLFFQDPNFSVNEFAVACGVPRRVTHRSDGNFSGGLSSGLRVQDGVVARPGTWDFGDPASSARESE
ncbi:hypothetical protein ABIB56_003499 [Glaciihabitans sp. UYNi722]